MILSIMYFAQRPLRWSLARFLDWEASQALRRRTRPIQHYVMLEQDRTAATVLSRAGDDWVGRVVIEGAIPLPEVGIELPLAAVYQNVWDTPPGSSDG